MNNTGVTVYFAGFKPNSTEEEFRNIFSKFGSIEKIFLHNTKNYGMVEYDNSSSCVNAIASLNQTPPLNLYVNMAKNQINNGNNSFPPKRSPQNFKFNQSNNRQSVETSDMPEKVEYEIEEYYRDEDGHYVTIFTDPSTNEIYVPLRYAPSLKKVTQKTPKIISNVKENRLSEESDNVERKVKITKDNDSIPKITIQKTVEADDILFHDNSVTDNIKNNSFKKVFGNATYNPKNFGKKRFEQNGSFNKNQGPRYGENRNTNGQFNSVHPFTPGTSKFQHSANPKSGFGGRPQKHFQDVNKNSANNEEEWDTPLPKSIPQARIDTSDSDKIVQVSSATEEQNAHASIPKTLTKRATPNKVNQVKSEEISASLDKKVVDIKSQETSTFCSLELPKNVFTEVHVEKAISNIIGWVTQTSKTSEFEQLTLDICEIVMDAPTCNPEVGKLVLGFYEELWFRAVVLSTSPVIKVRYIDYGNEEIISKTDIKQIPSELAKIPAFALCIKLVNGAPCDIVNDMIIKVKPVKKENELVVVHVEHGIYPNPKEIVALQATKGENIMGVIHKLLLSQIKIQDIGFLELNIELSKSKYIATFMPLNLTEGAAKLQSLNPAADPSFKPDIGDIACAENEDGWQRVYILQIEIDFYTVAFIDFGHITNVSEIRSLPDEYINIPIFSCVCSSKNNEDLSQIKEAVDFEITDISDTDIDCSITFEDKLIKLVCIPWDPPNYIPTISKEIYDTDDSKPVTKSIAISALQEIILTSNEDIKLEMEIDGILYVRNKKASEIRKKIDNYMASYGSQAPAVDGKPYVGQLVTAEFEGDYYRAVIKSIKNDGDVTICYIDYGNEETKPYFSLKKLNEEIAILPISIIKIRLKNFTNEAFSVKALQFLEGLSVKKTILKATCEDSSNNEYELKMFNGLSISEELKKLDEPAPRPKFFRKMKPHVEDENEFYKTIKVPDDNEPKIYMSSLPLEEIPLGKTEVIFQQFTDVENNMLCVCINKPEILHKVHVELQNNIAKYVKHAVPNSHYTPESEECILVQNEGKWFRGACTIEPVDGVFTIFLIDYGSSFDSTPAHIRRMPKEFATENALCNFAKFHGLPERGSQNLYNRLKTVFERNNAYSVDVLEKNEEEEFYVISFPTIMKLLKKENLV